MSTYLIWSNQRQAWWGPNGNGYTLAIEEAGRYPHGWAERIVRDSTVNGQLVHQRTNQVTGEVYAQYDEVLVLSPESEVERARELEEALRELGQLRGRARADAAVAPLHEAIAEADRILAKYDGQNTVAPTVKRRPPTGYDGHPTILKGTISVTQTTAAYRRYAAALDESHPGWHEDDDTRMAEGLAILARSRRAGAVN